MFGPDSTTFASDRRNPSADIAGPPADVDTSIARPYEPPRSIVRSPGSCSDDPCRHGRYSTDTRPIGRRRVDWSHARESLERITRTSSARVDDRLTVVSFAVLLEMQTATVVTAGATVLSHVNRWIVVGEGEVSRWRRRGRH
jgi:hypothetical protein